jgi:regulatory LuxR family protein
VAEGIGNRDVARQLTIKENTVKNALLGIYDTRGVSNRVELVLYVLTPSSAQKRSTPPTKTEEERLALDCVDRGQVNVLGTDGTCLPRRRIDLTPCRVRPAPVHTRLRGRLFPRCVSGCAFRRAVRALLGTSLYGLSDLPRV